ncbi:MAG: MOSC domain-containing protein [Hyphomicrobiales bacterium]
MSPSSESRITAIYRYPVKGLSADRMPSVRLEAGETLPLDRAYAIEASAGRFDPQNPEHLPKIAFLMLMRNERLAALDTRFEEDGHVLTVLRNGRQVARGALQTPIGCQLIEQFMASYMTGDLRGAPRVVSAPGHSFTDMAEKCVHIVNMASVRELERIVGRPVDPLRFRANFYVEMPSPWAELGLVGKKIGFGEASLEVFDRTGRCEATAVDPSTGARDMAVTATLSRVLGHTDFGVYARISSPGTVSEGDALALDGKA